MGVMDIFLLQGIVENRFEEPVAPGDIATQHNHPGRMYRQHCFQEIGQFQGKGFKQFTDGRVLRQFIYQRFCIGHFMAPL